MIITTGTRSNRSFQFVWVAVVTLAILSCCHLDFFAYGWTPVTTTTCASRSPSRMQMKMKMKMKMNTHMNMGMSTKSTSTPPRSHIVIAGGGFGGMTCYNEVRKLLPSADVTIVEPNERFCFLPLLYEYLGGTADLDEIAPTYDFLLKSSSSSSSSTSPDPTLLKSKYASAGKVSIQRGSAVKLDPDQKQLTVSPSTGDTDAHIVLQYDALVVSPGLPPKPPLPSDDKRAQIPSTAYAFATLDDAVRLKRRLGGLPMDNGNNSNNNESQKQSSSIVIVGGGYVGSELACTLSNTVPKSTKITILHRNPEGVCNGAEDYNRESAQTRLDALGVDVKLGVTVTDTQTRIHGGRSCEEIQFITNISNINEDGTDMAEDSTTISADILIWTVAGISTSPRKTIAAGLPVDGIGRVKVDEKMQVQGVDDVYAIGDGAAVVTDAWVDQTLSESPLRYPGTAQVAMQQASVAAYNLQLKLQEGNGQKQEQPPKTFNYLSLGEMLSLGGDEDASISSLNGLFKLKGPLASSARRLTYAARMPEPKQKVRAGAGYILGGFVRAINLAAEAAADSK